MLLLRQCGNVRYSQTGHRRLYLYGEEQMQLASQRTKARTLTLIIFNTYGFSTVTMLCERTSLLRDTYNDFILTTCGTEVVSAHSSLGKVFLYRRQYKSDTPIFVAVLPIKSGPSLRRWALSSPVLYNAGRKFLLYLICKSVFAVMCEQKKNTYMVKIARQCVCYNVNSFPHKHHFIDIFLHWEQTS